MDPVYTPDHIKADFVHIRVDYVHQDKLASLGHATLYRSPLAFLSPGDRVRVHGTDTTLLRLLPPALPLSEVLHQINRFTCEVCGYHDAGSVGGTILCSIHSHLGVM